MLFSPFRLQVSWDIELFRGRLDWVFRAFPVVAGCLFVAVSMRSLQFSLSFDFAYGFGCLFCLGDFFSGQLNRYRAGSTLNHK